MKKLLVATTLGLAATAALAHAFPPRRDTTYGDWPQFGYDAARRDAGPLSVGITRDNVGSLVRQQVPLDGTVDSSPIYVRGAVVGGARHSVYVVTTTFGKAIAIDALSGVVLWDYTPPGYDSWAGTPQITTSSPALDSDRAHVYTASPDGLVHKLSLDTGEELRSGAWPVRITLDPAHEKIGTALNLSGRYLIATTGGYPGDVPPYVGHIVVIDPKSGRVVNVWNALCSDRHELIAPDTCRVGGAAVWARAGVVVQPGTGNLLLATGNGIFDGRTRWSMSVVMLSPDGGRVLRYWTPTNWQALASVDEDLGSTAPALVSRNIAVQGGKDGKLHVLDLRRLARPASVGQRPRLGGAVQTLPSPGGARVFTTPAVWRTSRTTWLFVTTNAGTAGYVLQRSRLKLRWSNSTPATSPVVSGGLLYAYDWDGGRLNVYTPTTGTLVASLPAGRGHWNTPIVTDGRIALGQEDANAHVTFGSLNIYHRP